MGAGHTHGSSGPADGTPRSDHRRRLAISFVLIATFFVVELVAGLVTNSLALLSDAGHMFTDVLGLGMALAAMALAAGRHDASHRTFGLYRLEVLAILANAVLLFGVAFYVLYEAVRRLGDPPEVLSGTMLVVGAVGLAVNVVVFVLLRQAAKENLNVQGAYLEVVADALGSVGVIAAAAVVQVTGWRYADPVVAVVIGMFILPRTWRLGRQAVRILVQAAPTTIDIDAMRRDLEGLPAVVDVHDLHVWTLTSEMEVASAHLMVGVGTDTHAVLDQASALLRDRYRVSHATLQVEPDDHQGCADVTW